MRAIINLIRSDLQNNIDEITRQSSLRYFKESVHTYGVKSAMVATIGKKHFKSVSHLSKNEIFDLCEELWKSNMMEECFIACHWSNNMHNKFEPADIKVFEHWINSYVTNWATCDTLCNHTVGEFFMKYPNFISVLNNWAISKNLWMRRASAVSLIIPARKGLFLKDIFGLAEILLTDSEDMVQKGYGWMLKAASEVYRDNIFSFVMNHKVHMPRTALRYAIEKMPEEMKKQAMAKEFKKI
jgi:3-methyladenine DNA glycosylase AlkD